MPADEAQRARVGMSWEQMERATIAAERDEYRRSRPGERVERMLELIRELGPLAARGRARARGGE